MLPCSRCSLRSKKVCYKVSWQIFRIGTVHYTEGLWRMRRHGPVIVHCTNSEDFLVSLCEDCMATVIELLMMPLAVSLPLDVPWIYRHVHLCPHSRGPFSWQKQADVSSMNADMWCCRNCGTECCVCVNVPDNVNFTWRFFSHRMQPKL